MRITLSQITPVHQSTVILAAEQWLLDEGTGAIPVQRTTGEGREVVGIEQLVDGVLIATSFSAEKADGGTRVIFRIRMRGQSLGSKIRNLGMLPMTRIVRRQAEAQFQQFLAQLQS